MGMINLNLDQLKRISSQVSGIDKNLISGIFPQMQDAISGISTDVRGSELSELLKTINTQFQDIKSSLSGGLATLETFIDGQLKNYEMTEEQAHDQLVATLNKMMATALGNPFVKGASVGAGVGSILSDGKVKSVIAEKAVGAKSILPEKKSWFDNVVEDIKDNNKLFENKNFLQKIFTAPDVWARGFGDIAQGGFTGGSKLVDKALGDYGELGDSVMSGIGGFTKSLGKDTFAEPVTNFLGNGAEKIGEGISQGTDKLGDGIKFGVDTIGKFNDKGEQIWDEISRGDLGWDDFKRIF